MSADKPNIVFFWDNFGWGELAATEVMCCAAGRHPGSTGSPPKALSC